MKVIKVFNREGSVKEFEQQSPAEKVGARAQIFPV